MEWPLETVRLIDAAGDLTAEWCGYLAPRYLAVLPNEPADPRYTLKSECGLIWPLGCGDLYLCVWDALMVHESWCLKRPSIDKSTKAG